MVSLVDEVEVFEVEGEVKLLDGVVFEEELVGW